MKQIKRSPLFYVGDKHKLMEDLSKYFPKKINKFIEPFTGGGTVFLNVEAKKYVLNDIDQNVVKIHKFLLKQYKNKGQFFKKVHNLTIKFNLSRSYKKDIIPNKLKSKCKKTYYARFNKVGYNKLKNKYNLSNSKNPLILYLLLIYGFNRMLRFNLKGYFNVPVGNVDFNKNVEKSLLDYFQFVKDKKITLKEKDFMHFLKSLDYKKNDFVYLDPPYLISFSEYNKLWNEEEEERLLNFLDKINKRKIKFAISNIILHKGKRNKIFIDWMKKYKKYKIKSNYISYHNNGIKKIEEVLVTNY